MRRFLFLVVTLFFSMIVQASEDPNDITDNYGVTQDRTRRPSIFFGNEFGAPNEFANVGELRKWCDPLSFNNVLGVEELHYKKYRVFVIYRMHTSGVFSSEPTAYLGIRDDANLPLMKIANFLPSNAIGLSSRVEGSFLVIYSVSKKGKPIREYGRFNLKAFP